NQLKHLPILFAGGGGGASKWANGGDATTSGSGTNTTAGSIQTNGGTNGNGGQQGGLDGAGGAGGGFLTNGGNWVNNNVTVTGGQGYVNGNYGGTNPNNTGTGGWGGGSAGANVHVVSGTSAQYYSGGGGGGGGYSGGAGASNGNRTTPSNSGGGGGGSFSSALGGRADSSGVNTGNGLVTIYGPNVSTEEITVPGPSYTWPANGNTYFEAGTWLYVDKQNFVVRVLNLSFGTPINCGSYTTYDTTVVDTTQSYYTWYRNGRLYTENTVDSIRIGCNKYILRLTVAPPGTGTANTQNTPAIIMRQMNMGEPEAQGLLQTTLGYDWSAKSYRACRNSTATFTMSEVPFATSYNWILPNGATGSSNTNEITVSFGNSFTGGLLGVAPVNAVGVGDTLVMNLNLALTPPTGQLNITQTPTPFVSGFYEVTPIDGATTYTWSVSNAQASIINGQGTPRIQLEQMPGFSLTKLSVVASNCKGSGPRRQIRLEAPAPTPRLMAQTGWSVAVWPNPSNGMFVLSSTDLLTDATLEIYSMDGRLVHQQDIPAYTTETSINLQNASNGLYQIRMVSGSEARSLKVVVEK
ncbi:MAG: T9SS type A sorting domain-containing protein, partial [Bacteroidia bacterium]